MIPGVRIKYLLTGATGFLGSHIMTGLLQKGIGVAIAGRSSGSESLQERINKLLAWFGMEHAEGLLEFYETDFLRERLGLSEDEYDYLCNRGLSIIHCASDTSFSERSRERVMKSNVESLSAILDFACKSKSPCFHYISTAFASGTDREECHEDLVNPVNYTNVYEESKSQAEEMVSGRCIKEDIPYSIIRPSIVYGDSVTGRSLKFNALYIPVRSVQVIRDIYLGDIKNHNGIKAAECGIYLNDDGILHLPLKIFIPRKGSINLIPVDYFTSTVLNIPPPHAITLPLKIHQTLRHWLLIPINY
jgi:thioester reductase-like protein